jgi:hypothetical protein
METGMKKARIFAAFAAAALSTLPVAAMAQTVGVAANAGATAAAGVDLSGVTGIVSSLLNTVTGLLGSGTGLLSGLGL